MADIVSGHIVTEQIKSTHTSIKALVEEYKEVNLEVEEITQTVRMNWVGKGRNEFESQYNLLIKKIEDFGDALQEIYDALVDAESVYIEQDETMGRDFNMEMQG